MTQAKKFPKHLKSENWCLESMRLIVSRWAGRKQRGGGAEEGGWEDERQGKPELWLTLPAPGARLASHLFRRSAI